MGSSEKKVEEYLRKAIERKGGKCIKLLPFNFNGLPDRLCLLPGGRLFFAETKSTGDGPSKIQRKVHEMLTALGFYVYVIDGIEQVGEILKGKPWVIQDIGYIALIVSNVTGIPQKQMFLKLTGDSNIIRARQMVHYFAKHRTNLTLAEIGSRTGDFDHSTVVYSCAAIEDLRKTDKVVKIMVDKIENELINTFNI